MICWQSGKTDTCEDAKQGQQVGLRAVLLEQSVQTRRLAQGNQHCPLIQPHKRSTNGPPETDSNAGEAPVSWVRRRTGVQPGKTGT